MIRLQQGDKTAACRFNYARFGIPITILTTAAGVLVLLLLH